MNAPESEVKVVLVEVNEASAAVVDTKAPMPSTYTIPALAMVETGAGVKVDKGGKAPATLVSFGPSLAFTDTIPTLVWTIGGIQGSLPQTWYRHIGNCHGASNFCGPEGRGDSQTCRGHSSWMVGRSWKVRTERSNDWCS